MHNPPLVEVIRGNRVESCHSGAIAVVDVDGRRVVALGDVDQPVFPRSAIKALQALVMVESGGADRFRFGSEELALACASHSGEPGHIATATRMLSLCGLDESALKCGTHWPANRASARALAKSGATAGALHNNCSGKHAGFLCAACALDADRATYIDPAHPVQREVKAILENLSGVAIPDHDRAIDGCSVPTWALPLVSIAHAFARFGTGRDMGDARVVAAQRLRTACAENPWHVAGTGRFATELMKKFGMRVFVKPGAEGMCCAALPEQGLGITVKCDDGAGRAAEVMMAAMLARFLSGDADRAMLDQFVRPPLHNWNGIRIGEIRPSSALA